MVPDITMEVHLSEGFFNWQAVKEFDTLVFVEGAFDVLACMAVGLPNAIPIGTTLDAGLLPINVCNAIMGLTLTDLEAKHQRTYPRD